MNRKYILMNYEDITDKIIEDTLITDKSKLRKSNENKVLVSYIGDLPLSLKGKTSLTHFEALEEIKKDVWKLEL